ncbi:response regulator transcription factor [Celeribacter ethanolicus]|uniref:response regulator transcription factor n=1 Tax=Celeribacter ethanolicus TaxID=1758178 RepID=UPI00082BE302|nr:response regulator transcription factor [Celeribacter ethanolicus]TNE69926.1 MAG: response regulator transcription factor [Paracoccaceae bacterium]
MTRIFLLEDDVDICRLISRSLESYSVTVECFQLQAEFLRAVERNAPDLCLIDLSLPDGDGLNLLRHGTLPDDLPRIIVSGRSSISDRILGLEIGADDYIVKPFEPREMIARIRAVLRRSEGTMRDSGEPPAQTVAFGDWTVDFDACVLHHKSGDLVELSSAEAELLQVFVKAPGRVLSRNQLLDATTGRSADPFDRSMDARISRLRRKLRDDPRSPKIIRTVYGAGYVFSAPSPKG